MSRSEFGGDLETRMIVLADGRSTVDVNSAYRHWHTHGMSGREPHPGVKFTGFALPLVLIALLMVAYGHDYFGSLGWDGGEYLSAMAWTVVGVLLVGACLLAAPTAWRSLGVGMLIGGSAGILLGFAFLVLVMVALARTPIPF